jgi:hypothetical protein
MNPSVRGELFYDSRFDKWSRTEWIGGAALPLNRHVELEGYFDYQHDAGGDHNRKVNAHRHGAELVLLIVCSCADASEYAPSQQSERRQQAIVQWRAVRGRRVRTVELPMPSATGEPGFQAVR